VKPSPHAHAAEEAVHLVAERPRLASEFGRRAKHDVGGVSSFAHGLGDAGNIGGNALRPLRGMLDVPRDFACGRVLLFNRRGNGRGDLADAADGLADFGDSVDCVSGRPWIAPTCAAMSSVAFAVCVASAFTSEATTAKPLPASPARAASIVAFMAF
jgi:hypothetical protein